MSVILSRMSSWASWYNCTLRPLEGAAGNGRRTDRKPALLSCYLSGRRPFHVVLFEGLGMCYCDMAIVRVKQNFVKLCKLSTRPVFLGTMILLALFSWKRASSKWHLLAKYYYANINQMLIFLWCMREPPHKMSDWDLYMSTLFLFIFFFCSFKVIKGSKMYSNKN